MIGRLIERGPRTGLLGALYRWKRARAERVLANTPFYRAHPYRGHSPLRAVDWHTVVDFDLGVVYHRIPKVANSSLVASMLELKRQRDAARGAASDQGAKRELRDDLLHPSNLSAEQLARVPTLLPFVFVRNPYTRVLSAYLSKVHGKVKSGERINLRPGRTGGAQLSEAPTFAEFCAFLRDGGLYANGHWTPQVDFLLLPVARYAFVGKFEQLDKDFAALATRLARCDSSASFSKEDPGHATGASGKVAQHYTPELREMVHSLYRADFDAFGYARELPA